MMKNKRWLLYLILLAIAVVVTIFLKTSQKPSKETSIEIRPSIGAIQTTITSTAIVQPQNRLEIKPPINGRIDEILIKEGDAVKAGQILAWMSSTERAALLDAARARGPEAMKYWADVYKSTPLISPIDGEVIVSQDEPGQIVTSADAVLVLSDRLIVQAQVDETDIGGIRTGQDVMISLDAYPEIKVNGKVDHIYYESTIVNNVTIYKVDIIPQTVPEVFRSGMTATVNIVEKSKDDVLMVPIDVVKKGKSGSYVLLIGGANRKPIEKYIETGISDDKFIEVMSGLTTDDRIIEVTQKYTPLKGSSGATNPLMPMGRRGR